MAEDKIERIKVIPKSCVPLPKYSPSIFDETFFAGCILPSIERCHAEMDSRLEYALRNLVIPPIKGEITRGKIKWRGLRLVYGSTGLKMEKEGDAMQFSFTEDIQLWQRDTRIL